ncbi:MAG: hypothetical protein HKO88_05740, partial [Xanthomonadales bacterium]|nr:hypothetical protein [Xanthomonadales bacterium]
IATPIADLFPAGTFDHIRETEIIAILLIVGTSIFLGILSKIKAGRVIGRSIERNTLDKVPMYRMLKSLVGAFLNIETEESFKPALLENDAGDLEPVYVIEDSGRPRVVVLVPWAPTAFAGSVKLVQRERVYPIDVSLDEFSLSLTHLGTGMSALLPDQKETSDK